MFISNLFSVQLQFMRKPILKSLAMGLYSGLLTLCVIHSAYAVPTQDPLFLSNPVVPLAMLNMTKDHQLYMKLYDDYSDLDGDGTLDITYKNSYSYYGYFDNKKCYDYNITTKRYEPKKLVNATTICGGDSWSGNFLNWSTMTRIDAVRKILYGGYRSTDNTDTVLERVLLPHDGHAFVKYYNGTDLSGLIPSAVLGGANIGLTDVSNTGISICNVTHATTGVTQDMDTSTYPPLLRIAKGNFSLWAAGEARQCAWGDTESGPGNANVAASSGINAFKTSPNFNTYTQPNTAALNPTVLFIKNNSGPTDKLGLGDYIVRAQVCKSGLLEDNCKEYSTGYVKPRGLLHKYGEITEVGKPAKIKFGLITGSFSKNKSGGVVRKNISDMTNEINATTGVFNSTTGIVATLNKLRIRAYDYQTPGYTSSDVANGRDNCNFGLTKFADGQCTTWGNPQSEMYLQSLLYFAGKKYSSDAADIFDTDDSTKATGIPGLARVKPTEWVDPLNDTNYCSPLNVIQFNASVTSYDNDQLAGFSYLSSDLLSKWTNEIGKATHENLSGNNYIVGRVNVDQENPLTPMVLNLCTSKMVGDLANVAGTCPDAPHVLGTYNIAGLAYFARNNDIRPTIPSSSITTTNENKIQTVRTYGVELAPAIPYVDVPVPGYPVVNGVPTKVVKILPACANHGTAGNNPEGNCGLVGFRVVKQVSDATTNSGILYVSWEAAEQGGDYDQDMWGVIKYKVTNTKVEIKTDVLAQSSGRQLGFGYVLSGTDGDGFHVWSGSNGFNFPVATIPAEVGLPTECANCQDTNAETVAKTYNVSTGATGANFLRTPLYYAAKWGGYSKDFETAAQDKAAKESESYGSVYLTKQIKARDPTKDSYFYATDPLALEDALDKTFSSVANDTGSAASVATNSARLAEDNYIFQAQFRSGTWDGSIKGYEFDADGSIKTTNPLVSNAPTSRKIYIKKGTALADFTWSNLVDLSLSSQFILSPESTGAMAQKRVAWLMGSDTDEFSITNSSGVFRSRTFTVADGTGTKQVRNVFGDIVNSSPAYVGAFNYSYKGLSDGGDKYLDFVKEKKGKDPMIYIGANDGMMHGFDAKTLTEKFAYVVTSTLSKMAKLPALDYGKSLNKHQYLVDGPVVTGDAYFQGVDESEKSWHTIVVGTLGAGGKGIYALDVTDADEPKLLWELTDTDIPGLGYVMGKPFILPLTNGRWGVILGNGDSSVSPLSKLIVIDLVDPLNKSATVNTTMGTGLSAPAVLVNAKGEATTVYAGDLKGNLFKFDIKDLNPTSWTYSLIFVAKDSGDKLQPITAAPTIGINNQLGGKYMVYFGTGKYFEDGDNTTPASPEYSFYAIADMGTLISRASLLSKTISYSNGNRVISTTNPNWSSEYGWYLDFTDTDGERVTTKALLIQDKLIFPTLIPSSVSCEYGGKSWLMEVPAVGDKFKGIHLLDKIEKSDFLILGDLGFGMVHGGIPPAKTSNSSSSSSSSSSADKCSGSAQGAVLASTSKATLLNESACLNPSDYARQSWRQLR